MAKTNIVEQSAHWDLPLRGEVVTQCRYDYAFTLLVGELEPSLEVRIEQQFTLYTPKGAEEFDPEGNPQDMSDTLRLLRGTVTRSIAHKDGRLEIDFDDGSCLRVPAGDHYEAWNVAGPEGALMVSIPGGDLAVWSE